MLVDFEYVERSKVHLEMEIWYYILDLVTELGRFTFVDEIVGLPGNSFGNLLCLDTRIGGLTLPGTIFQTHFAWKHFGIYFAWKPFRDLHLIFLILSGKQMGKILFLGTGIGDLYFVWEEELGDLFVCDCRLGFSFIWEWDLGIYFGKMDCGIYMMFGNELTVWIYGPTKMLHVG